MPIDPRLLHPNNHIISSELAITIQQRLCRINNLVCREIWNRPDQYYVLAGSYGRNTAINTSDIDVLIKLPKKIYNRYDQYKRNGQSALLQFLKDTLHQTYPKSHISADGQVVKIDFSDDTSFELVPAFEIKPASKNNGLIDEEYVENVNFIKQISNHRITSLPLDLNIRADNPGFVYPDSNNGGDWRHTNPLADQQAMQKLNKESQGLLCDLCRHLRYIRDGYFHSYHIKGILIDSFCYDLICNSDDLIKSWGSIQHHNSILHLCNNAYQKLDYGLIFPQRISTPGLGHLKFEQDDIEKLKKVIRESYSINYYNIQYQ